jgi:hypothetical protein
MSAKTIPWHPQQNSMFAMSDPGRRRAKMFFITLLVCGLLCAPARSAGSQENGGELPPVLAGLMRGLRYVDHALKLNLKRTANLDGSITVENTRESKYLQFDDYLFAYYSEKDEKSKDITLSGKLHITMNGYTESINGTIDLRGTTEIKNLKLNNVCVSGWEGEILVNGAPYSYGDVYAIANKRRVKEYFFDKEIKCAIIFIFLARMLDDTKTGNEYVEIEVNETDNKKMRFSKQPYDPDVYELYPKPLFFSGPISMRAQDDAMFIDGKLEIENFHDISELEFKDCVWGVKNTRRGRSSGRIYVNNQEYEFKNLELGFEFLFNFN